mmetsp:Transcript_116983/g.309083  ORF Transcript_116983/g.309083 Transcript_116983/m.309083 type:complete len:210 (+) Transcript_116983:298-927(+)
MAAKAEVDKVQDSLLRLQADLQNYRRQHNESMSRAKDLGKKDTMRALLPVMDDIAEALVEPADLSEKESAIFTSYSLLTRKVADVFDKLGVQATATEVGEKLNPDDHLKVEEREAPGDESPGTILEVLRQGYRCDGQVVIPSEVAVVAFPPEEEAVEAEAPAEEDKEEEAPTDEEGEAPAEDEASADGGGEEGAGSAGAEEKVKEEAAK